MTLEEHIEVVMDNFDFHKVRQVMEVLDWQWHDCAGVPEIPDMRKRVRSMMKSIYACRDNERTERTGGFEVYFSRSDDYFHVAFVVEYVTTDME